MQKGRPSQLLSAGSPIGTPSLGLFYALVILVAAVWTLWGLFGPWVAVVLAGTDSARAGQWGDTFGALNALFSALGFVAIFVTLRLQQAELDRQSERLRTADADRHVEQFERSFFQLLDLMRELRTEIRFSHSDTYLQQSDVRRSSEVFSGASALRAIELEVKHWFSWYPDAAKEVVAELYEQTVHVRAESTLSPFFRVAYTILRRISEDEVLRDDQKAAYGNLLRAQMTSPELTIAGINGLHAVSANFANYLTEFRMFKYLPEGPVRATLSQFYPHEAFEGRD